MIGSEKGYCYPFEISVNPKDKKKVRDKILMSVYSAILNHWLKEEKY
jgi:hypothetical protein